MQEFYEYFLLIFQRKRQKSSNLQGRESVIQWKKRKEAHAMQLWNRQTAALIPAMAMGLLGALCRLPGWTAAAVVFALLGAAFSGLNAWRLRPWKSIPKGGRKTALQLFPAAVLALIAAVLSFSSGLLSALLCVLTAASLAAMGWLCLQKTSHPLPHLGLTLALVLKLILDFRHWSAIPQVSDYCFRLFALLCAIFAALYHSGLQMGIGKRRFAAFFCVLGLTLCPMAAIGAGFAELLFFLACLLYLSSLLCLLLQTRKKRPPAAS